MSTLKSNASYTVSIQGKWRGNTCQTVPLHSLAR